MRSEAHLKFNFNAYFYQTILFNHFSIITIRVIRVP